jgi:ankyrin repeat protein
VGDTDLIDALRQKHPDLASRLSEADRRQAAHAARNNDLPALRRMLEAGLPVDARSQHQATPLHWAAFHGNHDMLQGILRFGPPLEVCDADFQGTPLSWAVYGSEHGWNRESGDYAATVAALLRAGAQPPKAVAGTEPVQKILRDAGVQEPV